MEMVKLFFLFSFLKTRIRSLYELENLRAFFYEIDYFTDLVLNSENIRQVYLIVYGYITQKFKSL